MQGRADRVITHAHDLRQKQPDHADPEAADHRLEIVGDALDAIEEVLGPMQDLHEEDRHQRGHHAQYGIGEQFGRMNDLVGRNLEGRHIPQDRSRDDGRTDRADHDRAEGAQAELPQDDLGGEEGRRDGRVEGGRDAGGGAAAHAGANPMGGKGSNCPRVEPIAEPICTIGPSRPTDPPVAMQIAEAKDLATATTGRMTPPRRATESITCGTP